MPDPERHETATATAPAAPAGPRAGPPADWGPLVQQLRWFVGLRWIAGGVTIAGALADLYLIQNYGASARSILWIGVGILAYNAILHPLLRHTTESEDGRRLLLFAWAQLLLDFAAIAFLLLLTGGVRSPLSGLFVLHMVFASLLLPRAMAYAAAVAALAITAASLSLAGRAPQGKPEWLFAAGQAVTLFGVVFLATRITRALRLQRRRLLRQNRKIRRMARDARRHHRLMTQQEKMVALGQMASGVAHEIANPLASMDGLLQLAQRRPEKPRPELIAQLREQVSRIGLIIQQMRSFAHPGDAHWQAASPNDVVEQALAVLRFDKRMKRTRLTRDYAGDLGPVLMLPHALQQVVVNLVANALDAMESVPEPTLTIRTARREGQVLVEIVDNGPGIRRDHLKRLFEPFFTTKPVGKGTGLGLSISYSLVQKQGGHLSVRSEHGRGATFVIHLPVRPADSHIREADPAMAVNSGNKES